MAIFKRLKRAFGFDSQEYYEEDDTPGIDATVVPLRKRNEERASQYAAPAATTHRHDAAPSEAGVPAADSTPETIAEDAGMSRAVPSEIFKTVVEVFNRSLPDFLGDSVDAERQQKFLYDALDDGMKRYLGSLDRDARRRYDEMRHADMLKTETELKELREALRRQEEEAEDVKKSQLSAERQKRALNERVRDLEKQIATLQAESEQLDLENKSLVNKLRINALQEKDVEAMRADAAELQEQLAKLRVENTRLSEGLEQAKLRDTLGETMVSDLQGRASEALKSVQEKERELAAVTAEKASLETQLAEMQTLRDDLEGALLRAATAEKGVADNKSVADDLRRQIDDLRAERDEARTLAEGNAQQLARAREKLTVIAEIQTQVEQLEEARLKTDAQIRRHKDELLEKDDIIKQKDSDISDKNIALYQKDAAIKRLEDQCDSLRKQLEDAEFSHSQTQSAMREEINRLKKLPAAKPAVPEESDSSDKSDKSDKSDLSELSGKPDMAPLAEPVSQKNEVPVTIVAKAPVSKAATKAGSIDYALDDLPIIETPVTKPAPKKSSAKSASKAESVREPEVIYEQSPKREPVNELPSIDDDANWLIPTPPKKTRQRAADAADSDDFGYKEPPRRPEPDNPAQMSLF